MATRKDKIIRYYSETPTNFTTKSEITKLFLRKLNYEEFQVIFDYKNEYLNSFRDVQMFEIEKLTSCLKNKNLLKENCMSFLGNKVERSNKKHVRQLVNVGFDTKIITNSPISVLLCYEELPPSVELELTLDDPYQNSDNSSDTDYVPEEEQSDERSDEDRDVHQAVKISRQFQKEKNLYHSTSQQSFQHCEFVGCYSNVFACCEQCFCFLCMTHYESQTPFKNCINHQAYSVSENHSKNKHKGKTSSVPVKNDKENDLNIVNKKLENNQATNCVSHCEYANCKEEVFSTCGKCLCFLCFPHFHSESTYNDCQKHNTSATKTTIGTGESLLTKDGNLRKRRRFQETVENRKDETAKLNIEKLSLKKPCPEWCIKKCTSKITEHQRKIINKEYISLSWEARGLFMKSQVETKTVATRKTLIKDNKPNKRNVSYSYFFQLGAEKIEICKTFFLTTLGYHAKNDRRLLTALKRPANKQKDKRGLYERKNKIDTEIIKDDIKLYNPVISHYRREHAPHRLYLPSDVTIVSMYENFCKKYSNMKVSYEFYRQVLRKDMNVSFAHLGNEGCEVCAHHKEHIKSDVINNENNTCPICVKYESHKTKYVQARKAYKEDVKNSENSLNTVYFSVDLQKVIMLPRMEQFKSAIFCPRLIAYNESFVPLGTCKRDSIPFAAIWNESTSGRSQEDIISTFRAFLVSKRDKENIILWMDNSSAQNKNWAILSFLVSIINSNLISAQTITFKFFEPGHTFMSADSFHHRVEQSLQKKGKVYDFNDFIDVVKQAQKHVDVKIMEVSDFYSYSDLSSVHKVRKISPRIYLKDIVVVVAKRGHTH